jgi:transcriptional regulator with XRE-family HTH domain
MTTFDVNSQKLNKQDFQKALGNRIRQIRESKNISQTELGNLCDIERSNMNRIEAGNTNPSSYLLYVIAEKLEVKASELLNFNSTSE